MCVPRCQLGSIWLDLTTCFFVRAYMCILPANVLMISIGFSAFMCSTFKMHIYSCVLSCLIRKGQSCHSMMFFLYLQVGAGAPGSVGQPHAGKALLLEVWPEHSADRAAALGPAG